jgi:hypothetical protein
MAAGESDASMAPGDQATVQADVVRWLCSHPPAVAQLPHSGLAIDGVAVDGDLRLHGAQMDVRLALTNCEMQAIHLTDARTQSINLNGTSCSSLWADRVQVSGALLLSSQSNRSRRFTVMGPVSFLGARIDGDLDLSGATCSRPGEIAFDFSRARIGGSLFLRRLVLPPEQSTASVLAPEQIPPFFCEGAILLRFTKIDSALDCSGALLSSPWQPPTETDAPISLQADAASLGGVYLTGACRATGLVSFESSVVAGAVRCVGAQFVDHGFTIAGARIAGDLICVGTVLEGDAKLNFWYASVEQLGYAASGWPTDGRLNLTGLTYRSLDRWLTDDERRDGAQSDDIATFLEVIRHQTRSSPTAHLVGWGYSPQPYEQLARVLREVGQEEEARDVLIARTDDALRRRSVPIRVVGAIVRNAIGYGYRPFRVIWPIVFMLLVGAAIFSSSGSHFTASAQVRPPFSGVAFSFDSLVPFIDLGQEKNWVISTESVTWLSVYYWFHVVTGWLLTSFVVVGLTRSARS